MKKKCYRMSLPCKKSGFSLIEMLVVLLITAIIAAATAPMVTKKLAANSIAGGSNASPWNYIGMGNNIGFNMNGSDASVLIGASRLPLNAGEPKLYINTQGQEPAIGFGNNGQNTVQFAARDGSVMINSTTDNTNAGSNSVAIGTNQTFDESADNIVLIGHSAQAKYNALPVAAPENAIAIGTSSSSSFNSVSIGTNASAVIGQRFGNATAVGNNASANDDYATAIGGESKANRPRATAIGYQAEAEQNALAIGECAKAQSDDPSSSKDATYSIAIGSSAKAKLERAIAIGDSAVSNGICSIAIGGSGSRTISGITAPKATNNLAVALGSSSNASGESSMALGYGAEATNKEAIAIGKGANAIGPKSISIGINSKAEGDMSTIAIGVDSNAKAFYSVAIGQKAISNQYSAAIGHLANANSPNSVAIGSSSKATKQKSVAIGSGAEATYNFSTAIGRNAKTTADNQIALGDANASVVVAGGLEVKGNFTQSSDRRLKNVGEKFTGGLSELNKLELFNFTYKSDKNKTQHVGVMAQDLQKVFPNAVTKDSEGYFQIRFEDMFYAVINAVKELDRKIAVIVGQIKSHNDRITKLEETVKSQKQIIDAQQKAIKELNTKFEKQNAEFEKRLSRLEQ